MSVNSISTNTGYLARSSSSGQSCQQSQSSSSSSGTKKSQQGSVTVDFSTLAMLLQQAQSGTTQSSSQSTGSTQGSTFSLAGIGGTSASGMPPPPPGMNGSSGTGGAPPFKEMDQALSDLSSALQSGDIDGAKKALATFQSLAPKPPDASNDSSSTTASTDDTSTDGTSTDDTTTASTTTANSTGATSGSSLSDKLAALSDALDSGDTDSAKSAYEALMEDIQSHKPDDGMQARQRQHHMGQYMQMAQLGSDSTNTTSNVSTST